MQSLGLKDDDKGNALTPEKDGSNGESICPYKYDNAHSLVLDGFSGRKPAALFMTKRVNKESRDSLDLGSQYQQYLIHGGKRLFKV